MKDKKKPQDTGQEESTAGMIQQIRAGTLDPGILDREQRQLCVEALHYECISPSNIAQFLKVSDRTVRRDLAEIRVKNALTPNPDLARQIIGEYMNAARFHISNIMKILRSSSDASLGEKAQAAYYAYNIQADMIVKLQSVGYLPKSADELIVRQKNEENELNENLNAICAELDEMALISGNPAQSKKLIDLKESITIKDEESKKEDDKNESVEQ